MRKPCCDKQGTNKGAWSKQEDQKLIDYIRTHGEGCWRSLPKAAGLHRCGKSCRLRWINYLRPDLKRGSFGQDEEDLIIKLHALLGNRWSLIAGRLPGRTDNEVKNYWNSHMKRKLIKMGIDPNNHRLSPILSQPQNKSINSAANVTPSKSSMNEACQQPLKLNGDNDNDRVSDAASCLEEDETSDLNLHLSIAVPSSPNLNTIVDKKPQNITESTKTREVIETDSVPTLLLFR